MSGKQNVYSFDSGSLHSTEKVLLCRLFTDSTFILDLQSEGQGSGHVNTKSTEESLKTEGFT